MKFWSCLLLVLLTACSSNSIPIAIQRDFKSCFSGKANLSSLIETDGYYTRSYLNVVTPNSYNRLTEPRTDTLWSGVMFYDNGMFTMIGGNPDEVEKKFTASLKDPEGNEALNIRYGRWGACRISGDTLKCNYITHLPRSPKRQAAYEMWYKVISRTEVEEVYSKRIGHTQRTNQVNYNRYANERIGQRSKFIKTSVQPSFEGLDIFREDWFFCDTLARNKYQGRHGY